MPLVAFDCITGDGPESVQISELAAIGLTKLRHAGYRLGLRQPEGIIYLTCPDPSDPMRALYPFRLYLEDGQSISEGVEDLVHWAIVMMF